MLKEKLKNWLALSLIVVAATGLAMGAINFLPFLGSTERYVADFRIANLTPPEEQHPDIVFVAVTEDTLARFPYRSPIDRKFIADTVKLIEARGAKMMLIDVLFDTPTEEDKDDELRETLAKAKIPLIVSYESELDFLNEEQLEYLNEFVPPRIRAFANLIKDLQDQTVRNIFAGKKTHDGEWMPGVAGRVVQILGREPPRVDTPMAYRGRPGPDSSAFRKFPAHALQVLPAEWFKDKIIVFGADISDRDRVRTPFSIGRDGVQSLMPGAETLAHQIAQLIDGRKSPNITMPWQIAVVLFCAAFGMLLGKFEVNFAIGVGIAVLFLVGLWLGGFYWYNSFGDLAPLVTPSLALLASLGMTTAYTGRQERNQKKFIQAAFSKYLSPALLDEIVKDPSKLSLDAKRRQMSFIFTDVAGFTTMSERMDAAALAILLNRYLDGVCQVIFKHGGTVDKFIGDAVFAIFNAPREQENHAQLAVSCALDIDIYAEAFIAAERANGGDFGMTRIGVHTGEANVGNFGSADRFEYTALGDAVNTAARLEGANKYFGTRVCVSGAAAKLCSGDQPAFRTVGDVVLKGKTEPLELFEPMTPERAASPHIKRYHEAYALLKANDPQAEAAFEALYEEEPSDGLVAWRLEEIRSGNLSTRVEMHDK